MNITVRDDELTKISIVRVTISEEEAKILLKQNVLTYEGNNIEMSIVIVSEVASAPDR